MPLGALARGAGKVLRDPQSVVRALASTQVGQRFLATRFGRGTVQILTATPPPGTSVAARRFIGGTVVAFPALKQANRSLARTLAGNPHAVRLPPEVNVEALHFLIPHDTPRAVQVSRSPLTGRRVLRNLEVGESAAGDPPLGRTNDPFEDFKTRPTPGSRFGVVRLEEERLGQPLFPREVSAAIDADILQRLAFRARSEQSVTKTFPGSVFQGISRPIARANIDILRDVAVVIQQLRNEGKTDEAENLLRRASFRRLSDRELRHIGVRFF